MSRNRGTVVPDTNLGLEQRRSFAPRLLALGVLAAGLLFTLQHQVPRPSTQSAPAPIQYAQAALPVPPAAKPSAPQIPSVFEKELAMTPTALMTRWDHLVVEASRRFHVPQEWIRAVMRQESGGRTMLDETQKMVSSAGAMGIMQVMPDTYAEMRQQYRLGADPYDPHDNVMAGAAYLSWLHGKYGYPAMFAAYNDGPGEWEDHVQQGRALPAETTNYVQSIATMLKDPTAKLPGVGLATLTAPDGSTVSIDATKVSGVLPALEGEYPPQVQAVISMGRLRQAVREDVATVTARLRQRGAHF